MKRSVGVLTAVLLVTFSLAGCSQFRPSPEKDRAMRQVFNRARQGEYDALEAQLSPNLRHSNDADVLRRIHDTIPDVPPERIALTKWGRLVGTDGERDYGTYEYTYADRTLVVDETLFQPRDGAEVIENFHINALTPAEVARSAAFPLTGRTPFQYTVLALAVLSPLVIVAALIDLVRAKNVRRKWLWLLGMVWGVCGLSVNWSDGNFAILLIDISLFGASVSRVGLGAWVVNAALPLVALIFLFRDRSPKSSRRRTLQMLDLAD